MPTVATYYQLQDGEFSLETGGDIDRTLEQTVSIAPASGEGAILTWMARRRGTGSVTYEVRLNGTLLNTYTQSSADRFTVQETTGTSDVIVGLNRVEFKVTGGTGILAVGDVVLWHRVNVL